jgi:hypothetical protein
MYLGSTDAPTSAGADPVGCPTLCLASNSRWADRDREHDGELGHPVPARRHRCGEHARCRTCAVVLTPCQDYEDFNAINAQNGKVCPFLPRVRRRCSYGFFQAEAWLESFTKQLRVTLPQGQYILTHARGSFCLPQRVRELMHGTKPWHLGSPRGFTPPERTLLSIRRSAASSTGSVVYSTFLLLGSPR